MKHPNLASRLAPISAVLTRVFPGVLRIVGCGLFLTLVVQVSALADLEDEYIAARDGYISIEKNVHDDTVRRCQTTAPSRTQPGAIEYHWNQTFPECRRERSELSDLEKRLSIILGELHLSGFPLTGKINLQTLSPTIEFGMLDGLIFESYDKDSTILITTKGLLDRWLRQKAVDRPGEIPMRAEDALATDAFYTYSVVDPDTRSSKLGDLPVMLPRKATYAVARLAIWSGVAFYQPNLTEPVYRPDRVEASVIRGNRVFVAWRHLSVAIQTIPQCEQIWKTATDINKSDETEADYRRCLIREVSNDPHYGEALRQAQALVDSLPIE